MQIIQTVEKENFTELDGSSQPKIPNLKHVLKSQQFTIELLEDLSSKANSIAKLLQTSSGKKRLREQLSDKIAMIIFAEPSTRTYFSFAMACLRLGINCINSENATQTSSLVKGEREESMIRVLSRYRPDIIIMRQKKDGFMDIAAEICDQYGVHLINAGDGTGQHPSQAGLDVHTIRNYLGRLDNLNILIGGDLLRGRTVHSLAYLLAKFPGNEICFASPDKLALPDNIMDYLLKHDVRIECGRNFRHKKKWADVIYWTRIQSERCPTKERAILAKLAKDYIFCLDDMSILKNETSILMHPLPIKNEILQEVESDPRAVYFQQAENGLYIRMAILCNMFGVEVRN